MSWIRTNHFRDLSISAFIFFLVFGIYISSKDTTPVSDSRWTVYVAMSILKEGNIDLDEYAELIAENEHYAVISLNDHLYSFFPLGTPILAVPFIYVADKLTKQFWLFDLHEHISRNQDAVTLLMELFIASVITALTCVMMFLIARQFLSRNQSLLLVLILALGTSMWSTASRALWQHGPSMLMLSISLYIILLARNKPWLVQFASLPLAYAYITRPGNSISIIVITFLVLIKYRQYFLKYIFWASLIAIPFIISNFYTYNGLLPPYYLPQR